MIETPLMARGERTMEMNLEYARDCTKDSLRRGEAPFAMHLLYTQVLNDLDKADRALGITCGLEWSKHADLIVFYIDHGFSSGMQLAHDMALRRGQQIETRFLNFNGKYTKPTEASATSLVSNVQPKPGVF